MNARSYLLIDDNAEFAENLAEILRDVGAEVDVALSGDEAVEKVTARRYDAVLTDMRMPGLSGAQLVEALRSRDEGVPVVVLSAFTQDRELEQAREHGVLAVLSKPQPVPALLELLETARRDAVVMVVEDDPVLADNLTEVLRDKGLTVVVAKSVDDVDRIDVPPFVALVDLMVPGGEPGSALKRLESRYPGMPAVVITGYTELLPVAGAAACLAKPVDPRDLLGRLERLYEERVAR